MDGTPTSETLVLPAEPRPPMRLVRDASLGPFLAGNLASNVGTWLHNVAAAIVVFDLTGSAFLVGLLMAAMFGPAMLLSPWAGAVADRVDRRSLLVLSQGLAAAGGAGLAVWTALVGVDGLPGPWPLIGASAVIGVGHAFSIPTRAALVAALVPPRDLENALALDTVTFNLGRTLGPALGAAVMVTAGPATAFGINALSYGIFGVVLLVIRFPYAMGRPATSGSVRDGVRFVREDRILLTLLLAVGALGFASDPVNTLAPAIARELGGGDGLVGALVSAFGLGSVLAATTVSRVRRHLSQEVTGFFGLVLLAGGVVILAVAWTAGAALVALVVAGVGFLFAITALTARIYDRVPDNYRGRVLALWGVAFLGSRPVAALLDGAIADALSTDVAVMFAASTALVAAAAVRPSDRLGHPVYWIRSWPGRRPRGSGQSPVWMEEEMADAITTDGHGRTLKAPEELERRHQPLSQSAQSEMTDRETWNRKNPPDEAVVVRDLKHADLTPREYRNTKARFFQLGGDVRLQAHVSELPPGGKSVNHRHTTEAIIYIVKGTGYSMVGWDDDSLERIDWAEGDLFSFPVWMWHQHFNASDTETARYLAVQDTFHMKNIGLHAIERHPTSQ